MKYLNKKWNGAVPWILSTDSLLPARKKYVVETLYNSSPEMLDACNPENCMSDFIENDTTFLMIPNVNVPVLIASFKILGIKLKAIDYSSAIKNYCLKFTSRICTS